MTIERKLLGTVDATATEAVYIEDVMATHLYTGNATTQTITNGIDLSTNGGMVWAKNRTLGTTWKVPAIYDTIRGVRKALATSLTTAQVGANSGTSEVYQFNTDGFAVGQENNYDVNSDGNSFVSWTFRKQAKFFTICTWTGDGVAGRQISHDLGATPGMIIVKSTSAAYFWRVYHKSLGATQSLWLNDTSSVMTASNVWNDTSPTSTVFTVGTNGNVNESGQTYVAYLFADSNSGGFGPAGTDSVVACGSFTEPASGYVDVNFGWEPQYILFKPTSTTGYWFCMDTMRGFANSYAAYLYPNTSGAEVSGAYDDVIPTATGFKYKAGFFGNGVSFIYLAIRRGPMKTPTDATKVFYPGAVTGVSGGDTGNRGTGVLVNSGFDVDLAIMMKRAGAAILWNDRLRGNKITLNSAGTGAEGAGGGIDGAWLDYSGKFEDAYWGDAGTNPLIDYAFRRAPGFFDVVCYTGTGSATTVAHNLGVAPELIIIKCRNNSTAWNWNAYHAALGPTYFTPVNTQSVSSQYTAMFNDTAPTNTIFTVGDYGGVNSSGLNYVAYLFATCPGVSKCGSYTGSGTTKQIDCGFAAGARFVLIKRTDSTGDWFVWDTARGIVSGNDPYLLLNSTAAENTSTDYIDPYSAGFEISSSAPAAINASGGTFIYLAIA